MSAESDDGQTADTLATYPDTEHGEHGEHDEHDQGAFLTPESEVEAPSTRQDDTKADGPREPTKYVPPSCESVQTPTPPPHLEILSPRPSPHVPGKNRITAIVGDWEENNSHNPIQHTSSSPFRATTPPLVEASLSPGVQENTVKTAKSEIYVQDHKDEPYRRQIEPSDVPFQSSAQQNTSRRRPSVMDYLVSHGPVKYPMPTSRASSSPSRRVYSEGQHWQNNDRLPTHWGQAHGLPGYQVEERRQQTGWTTHQPSLRSLDKFLNVHDDLGSEVSHKRVFSQTWEQNGLSAPSSNSSLSNYDSRSDVYTSQEYSDLASRLDNMAPSGYHHLATKLSGDSCGQPIPPIYRRFEALNHRLLLYMQEEITDLERQLISLEARDTAKRSYAGGVLPASQRQDRRIDSSLAHQKTEILGLIGYKLSQYSKKRLHILRNLSLHLDIAADNALDHVIASYCKVQDIPPPTWRDIHMYKNYLATSKLIVDDETRFLDASNDLIALNALNPAMDDYNTTTVDVPTPMPEAAEKEQFQTFFRDNGSSPSARLDQGVTRKPDDALFVRLALSGTCVVLVPIMMFMIIPSFAGRLAIVLLVVLGASIMLDQSGLLQEAERQRRNGMVYFGLYCGAMAVLAGAVK
ncbi:hypothetical protein E4U55_002981 [Claviceps digitariae]|nr:hypothetical protein E4U55_002981 [Claviceps digitariae]